MIIPKEKVKFIVGLSNGESLTEGKGVLSIVAGEDSPWHKLQKYIKENNLKITSMSLYSKTEVGNRHYHLPNEKSKFGGEVPISYNCFRMFADDGLTAGSYEHYTVIEAVYKDFKIQLIASEIDPDKSWVNLVNL